MNLNFIPLHSKTVIITGGTSGIGRELAIQYARKGFNVAVSGRDEDRLKTIAEELGQISKHFLALKSDVSSFTDCEKLITSVLESFGSIDILINNAGISMRGLFAETNLDVLRKIMAVNFWGTVYCSQLALPHLIRSKGTLAGISSIAGKKGLPGRSGYSASKFAMEGFLETVRIENLKKGLHVLIVCPGFTASNIRISSLGPDGTPQAESPRDESAMMQPDAVAKKIIRAIDRRKRDLVLTSQGKLTIILNKFLPSFTDKLVYQHMAEEPGSPFK